jgi:hypothetical protein
MGLPVGIASYRMGRMSLGVVGAGLADDWHPSWECLTKRADGLVLLAASRWCGAHSRAVLCWSASCAPSRSCERVLSRRPRPQRRCDGYLVIASQVTR